MWSSLIKKLQKKPRQTLALRQTHFSQHRETARAVIMQRLAYFAPLCGVSYKRVAIRNQRRRWGSCSSLGNLNFNYRVVFLPAHLCDYVIVHELCHLKELNHGPQFWKAVAAIIPEYATCEAELRVIEKSHGARVPQGVYVTTSYFGARLKDTTNVV